jgi:hypothetical protein
LSPPTHPHDPLRERKRHTLPYADLTLIKQPACSAREPAGDREEFASHVLELINIH